MPGMAALFKVFLLLVNAVLVNWLTGDWLAEGSKEGTGETRLDGGDEKERNFRRRS